MDENLAKLRKNFINRYPELKEIDDDLLILSLTHLTQQGERTEEIRENMDPLIIKDWNF